MSEQQNDLVKLPANSIALAPGVVFCKYGMIVTPDYELPFGDWILAAQSLRDHQQESFMAYMWSWGDWITYGQRKYGEMYAQGLRETGLAYQTLANYKWVAGKTPRELRGLPGLGQRHYINVAKVIDYSLKSMLLIQASTGKWTAAAVTTALEKEMGMVVLPLPPISNFIPFEDDNDYNDGQASACPPTVETVYDNNPYDNPPPATQADQIDDLHYETHMLEKQTTKWFARCRWVEGQSAAALDQLRMLDNFTDEALRKCLDEAIVLLEKPNPKKEAFDLLVKVITNYEAGATTEMINALDALVAMVKNS